MRFHVVALPHTNTTKEFLACAYTAKVINFCRMMKDRGHTVILYGGESNEAPCDEHVVVAYEDERKVHVGDVHFTSAPFSGKLWFNANHRAIAEISRRAQPQDFICLIAGYAQKDIADAIPSVMSVEFGVGYGGTFSKYKVFESYAWMHMHYGAAAHGNLHAATGNWWDVVIPGYLDPAMFPFSEEQDDYFLFMGRLIDLKGYHIAAEVCEKLGKRLIIAGQGTPPGYGEYVGVVGPEERGRLMSRAQAVFVPTMYVEPFANVHVEAMACGTPVITTDWGVFTETVEQGVTGFRCRTFSEFADAVQNVSHLNRKYIRDRALNSYSLDVVGAEYENYFRRLLKLWGGGWYG